MYYIAHRLFAAHDRHLGALAAAAIADRAGEDEVFLPFCDTDEENLQAEIKGRRLYELDRARLDRIHGMLAILHGPSLDDGVCMEIGYAAHLGVPIVVLTTDFQTYGITEYGPELAFPDPLLQVIAPHIVRVPHLAPPPASGQNRLIAYAERNLQQLRTTIDRAVDAVLHSTRPPPDTPPIVDLTAAFYEPNPYLPHDFEGALTVSGVSAEQLLVATRHTTAADPLASARTDWGALQAAGTLIVDVRGPEAPPGAALMIGASRAAGRRTVALTSPHGWTFAHGREPNYRNLMIQYAVDERHDVTWPVASGRHP